MSQKMQKVKFNPLFDIVLVTIEAAPDTIGDSGLVQPEIAKEKPYHGTVLRCGPDVKNLKEGDHIVFTKYSGKPIVVDSVKFQYMKEQEVIGVLEDEAHVT